MTTTRVQPRDESGRFERATIEHSCSSCQLLRINGVVCHEIGCPEAWRDDTRTCPECGGVFAPEYRDDKFCSECCAANYAGHECRCDACLM